MLRSPEPHHPFDGRWRERRSPRGCSLGSCVVARRGGRDRRDRSASLSDLETADALIELVREIDRLEADVAQLAWVGPSTWDRQCGWFAVDAGVAAAAHRDARGRRACVDRGRPGVASCCRRSGRRGATGEITGGAAKTIAAARVEGHDLKLRALEDMFLMLGAADDQRELRRGVRPLPQLCAGRRHRPASARRVDDLGRLRRTHGRRRPTCPRPRAEIVVTAIHALTDPPSDGDTRTPARRRADALVQMAELALANLQVDSRRAGPGPAAMLGRDRLDHPHRRRVGPDRRRLHRHPPPTRTSNGSCATARSAGSSPAPTASPSTSAGPGGRSHPSSDERWRVRDHGCRYPGCTRPHGWTHAHHVIHWNDGGTTVLINLVSLCDHHHHVVHLPGWTANSTATPSPSSDPTAPTSPEPRASAGKSGDCDETGATRRVAAHAQPPDPRRRRRRGPRRRLRAPGPTSRRRSDPGPSSGTRAAGSPTSGAGS